jgi:hypothetical protein
MPCGEALVHNSATFHARLLTHHVRWKRLPTPAPSITLWACPTHIHAHMHARC